MKETATTLAALERSRLNSCEKTIQEHLREFIEVGEALREIRDSSLYRETHPSFEAYCRARWNYAKSRPYQLIAASQVVKSVHPGGQIVPILTERMVRPLTTLPQEKQLEAWKKALEVGAQSQQPLSVKIVDAVVRKLNPRPKQTGGGGGGRRQKKQTGGGGKPKPDYGKCPNCAGTKWDVDEDGEVSCHKCHHPHGEPAGDVDEERVKTQRSKTVKTVEALMRAFDDLQTMLAKPEHDEAIKGCKRLLALAKGWK